MLYATAQGLVFGMARSQGRVLIDAGLFTPIREHGVTLGVEPTDTLIALFSQPPDTDALFDVLVRFCLYHDMPDQTEMIEVCDTLKGMGVVKDGILVIYKAIRWGA
jgi:hypothetical protein